MRGYAMVTMTVALAATLANAAAAQPASAAATGRELFISPMGEPFRGASAAEQVRKWFSGADSNRDGALSLAEMRTDGQRWFGTLNTNHDSEIDPAELRIYEEQVAPEIRVGMGGLGITSGNGRAERNRLSGDFQKVGTPPSKLVRDTTRQGAGQYGLLATPNPVASTDANFNRGISPDEFARAARDRFMLLDSNRDGSVRFDELPALPSRALRKAR